MKKLINFAAFQSNQFDEAADLQFRKYCAYYLNKAKNIQLIQAPIVGEKRIQTTLLYYYNGQTGFPPHFENETSLTKELDYFQLKNNNHKLFVYNTQKVSQKIDIISYLKILLNCNTSYEVTDVTILQKKISEDIKKLPKGMHSLSIIGDDISALPDSMFFWLFQYYLIELLPNQDLLKVSINHNIDEHYATTFWFTIK